MIELNYKQVGDVFLPDVEVMKETETRSLRKYGMQRREFLKNHRRGEYLVMRTVGTLYKHLVDIQDEAEEMVQLLTEQLLENNPAPDKKTNQMGWVRHMNMTQMQAEEIMYKELLYV